MQAYFGGDNKYGPVEDQRSYGSYILKKNFRHDEFYEQRHWREDWTKNVLDLTNRSCLGHTAEGWLKLLVFYLLFYTFLVIFGWILFFNVFEKGISKNEPKVLKAQPGITFEPFIFVPNSHRIEYNHSNRFEKALYADRIENFLQKYGEEGESLFDICRLREDFGYENEKPCFYLKINKIIGFKPITYDSIDDFPKSMPKDYIEMLRDKFHGIDANGKPNFKKNRVWLSCQVDKKHKSIVTIQYSPKVYIEGRDIYAEKRTFYKHRPVFNREYKYYNMSDYNRVIAVKLSNVPLKEIVEVKCRFWAKNMKIMDNQQFGRGASVQFEVLIK